MSTGAPRRRLSVRARLTVLTSGLLCVTLAVGAVALTTVLSRSRVAELDDAVRARVATVLTLVTDDRLPPALPVAEPGEIAQVLDADGRVLASSATASRTLPVLPPDEVDRLAGSSAATGATPDASAVTVTATEASAYDDAARAAVVRTTLGGEPTTVVVTVPLGEVRGLLRALAVALVGVVPVLTALLGAVVWVVLGRVLAPVEALRRAAEQVARTGGPGSLPVVRADDEIGALARTLNEMLDRLELAAARQRTFVADAAHELRSPLAALRAATDVARAHPDAYRSAELAEELGAEVLRMQHLVDDLLLLARVGSVPPVRTAFDLRTAVDEALAVARGASPDPDRVAVVVTAASGPATSETSSGSAPTAPGPRAASVLGDPAAVVRVVRNLLDNALRHAASEVRVTVGAGEVVVDDDGTGVPVEDRERVFERFVRLGAARERDSGGSGLGLAIAREVAREHGGDVTLTDAPGGGLRAVLRLGSPPTAPVARPATGREAGRPTTSGANDGRRPHEG
ncbi:HAMP domain-containing histidine kinase [Actinotalea ferrariae]|uniref:sensor histidine kinase n=1 Tax=Actinotalea ferrariae TaxID=1386098 RepID=UPI001C8C6E4D|nr:HAMP domain-containing sensor histidine kinase [Actinotalea ferrariae]MBX9244729.1 HAMP domain-containing histidine kinase [Actinotalea ferrariae]